MNLRSITTLGIISLVTASTSYIPAEANSMEKYLNVMAMQSLMNQQAAAAAAAAAAAQAAATPLPAPTPAPVVYVSPYQARLEAEKSELRQKIYDLNLSLSRDNLSPRAYSRAQSKVANLQSKLYRMTYNNY